jgi:hypothetical protein
MMKIIEIGYKSLHQRSLLALVKVEVKAGLVDQVLGEVEEKRRVQLRDQEERGINEGDNSVRMRYGSVVRAYSTISYFHFFKI